MAGFDDALYSVRPKRSVQTQRMIRNLAFVRKRELEPRQRNIYKRTTCVETDQIRSITTAPIIYQTSICFYLAAAFDQIAKEDVRKTRDLEYEAYLNENSHFQGQDLYRYFEAARELVSSFRTLRHLLIFGLIALKTTLSGLSNT